MSAVPRRPRSTGAGRGASRTDVHLRRGRGRHDPHRRRDTPTPTAGLGGDVVGVSAHVGYAYGGTGDDGVTGSAGEYNEVTATGETIWSYRARSPSARSCLADLAATSSSATRRAGNRLSAARGRRAGRGRADRELTSGAGFLMASSTGATAPTTSSAAVVGIRSTAGPGPDFIQAAADRIADTIDCGSGRDVVRADPLDTVGADCELVTAGANLEAMAQRTEIFDLGRLIALVGRGPAAAPRGAGGGLRVRRSALRGPRTGGGRRARRGAHHQRLLAAAALRGRARGAVHALPRARPSTAVAVDAREVDQPGGGEELQLAVPRGRRARRGGLGPRRAWRSPFRRRSSAPRTASASARSAART